MVLTSKNKPLYMRIGRAPVLKRGKAGGDFVISVKEKESVARVVNYQPKLILPENAD